MLSTPWSARLAKAPLLASVLFVGIWADGLRGRTPDFFDPQSAIVALVFAWFVSEALSGLPRRLPRTAVAFLTGMALFGIVFAAIAYALPSFLVGLIQAPFGGISLIRSVFAGLFFTLRQAALPIGVIGAIAGLVSGGVMLRAVQSAPAHG
jgi:hypothetical protein